MLVVCAILLCLCSTCMPSICKAFSCLKPISYFTLLRLVTFCLIVDTLFGFHSALCKLSHLSLGPIRRVDGQKFPRQRAPAPPCKESVRAAPDSGKGHGPIFRATPDNSDGRGPYAGTLSEYPSRCDKHAQNGHNEQVTRVAPNSLFNQDIRPAFNSPDFHMLRAFLNSPNKHMLQSNPAMQTVEFTQDERMTRAVQNSLSGHEVKAGRNSLSEHQHRPAATGDKAAGHYSQIQNSSEGSQNPFQGFQNPPHGTHTTPATLPPLLGAWPSFPKAHDPCSRAAVSCPKGHTQPPSQRGPLDFRGVEGLECRVMFPHGTRSHKRPRLEDRLREVTHP